MSELMVSPLSPVIGAEMAGLDVSRPLDPDTFSRIHEAFLRHSVLVFREQHLSPSEHIAFSRLFGPPRDHVLTQYLHPDYPELLVVSNKKEHGKPIGMEDAGRYWHSDVSYEAIPPLGSMLYGLDVPPVGGDTLFANSYAAYDWLPQRLKSKIASLRARPSIQLPGNSAT